MERLEEMKLSDANRCPMLKNFSDEQKLKMYTDMVQGTASNNPHTKSDVIKEGYTKSKIEEISTTDSSSNGLIHRKPEKPTLMGCPFFNKEITDPMGKNLT